MTTHKLPLIQLTVRRDANTITPVTVPPHEVTILRSIFGKENVVEVDEVGAVDLDVSEEHARLSAKYGSERVERIYGEDGGERLAEVAARNALPDDSDEQKPTRKSTKKTDLAPEGNDQTPKE